MQPESSAIRRMLREVSLGSPDNAIGFVAWRVVMRYQREMDRALAVDDLTNLQFITLAVVAWFGQSDTPVTQVELARFSGIHPMQVSQTLTVLERKRMVLRRRHPADTRAKQVLLSDSGLKALRAAFPKAIAVQRRIFGERELTGKRLLRALLPIATADSGD